MIPRMKSCIEQIIGAVPSAVEAYKSIHGGRPREEMRNEIAT